MCRGDDGGGGGDGDGGGGGDGGGDGGGGGSNATTRVSLGGAKWDTFGLFLESDQHQWQRRREEGVRKE